MTHYSDIFAENKTIGTFLCLNSRGLWSCSVHLLRKPHGYAFLQADWHVFGHGGVGVGAFGSLELPILVLADILLACSFKVSHLGHMDL